MGLDVQNKDPLLSNNSLLIHVDDGDRSTNCDGLITLALLNIKRNKITSSNYNSFSFEAQHRINFCKTKEAAADHNLSFYPTKSTKYRLREYPIVNSMSQRRNGNINTTNLRPPQLELRLSLSPPTTGAAEARGGLGGARRQPPIVLGPETSPSLSARSVSPPSSCLSLELSNVNRQQDEDQVPAATFSSSPDATAMILVGCPRCYMYIMLSEDDRKCPNCKRTVLIDVLHEATAATASVAAAKRARKM